MNYNYLSLCVHNTDYEFQARLVKSVENYVFVITEKEEVIVYKRIGDVNNYCSNLEKQYILLTHPQERTPIFDVFIIDNYVPGVVIN